MYAPMCGLQVAFKSSAAAAAFTTDPATQIDAEAVEDMGISSAQVKLVDVHATATPPGTR